MLHRVRALVLGIVLLVISLALMASQPTTFGPDDSMRAAQVRSWFTQASLWLGVILVGVFFIGLVLEDRDRPRGYAPAHATDPDDVDDFDDDILEDDGDLRP